MSLHKLWC